MNSQYDYVFGKNQDFIVISVIYVYFLKLEFMLLIWFYKCKINVFWEK